MKKKPNYPITHLEDYSDAELRKLLDVVNNYVPEHEPVPLWKVLVLIAIFIGAFFVARWIWSLFLGGG